MADTTDENTQKLLDAIEAAVGKETARLRTDISTIIHEDTTDLRTMIHEIHEETTDLRAEMITVKEVLGSQSILLRAVSADIGSLKTSQRAQTKELHRLGVLFEDLDDRFTASDEME